MIAPTTSGPHDEPPVYLQPACQECGRRGRDVDHTARHGQLMQLCRDCSRPSRVELDAERRAYLPGLAADWVIGTAQDSEAQAVLARLRPDLSPMLRLRLLEDLGLAVLRRQSTGEALTALIGHPPITAPIDGTR